MFRTNIDIFFSILDLLEHSLVRSKDRFPDISNKPEKPFVRILSPRILASITFLEIPSLKNIQHTMQLKYLATFCQTL